MLRATPTLALALALASCGGGGSPEKDVMATEVKALEALTSAHPERSCQYRVEHDKCIGAVATLKAAGIEAKAAANIPDDWRDRLKKAKVVVNGDTATLSPGPTGGTAHFVKRDGRWLAEG